MTPKLRALFIAAASVLVVGGGSFSFSLPRSSTRVTANGEEKKPPREKAEVYMITNAAEKEALVTPWGRSTLVVIPYLWRFS